VRARRHGARGAIIVETSLSLSLVLMLLIGSVQVAVASYYQISLDAAMQAHTRATALAVPNATVQSSIDAPYANLMNISTASGSATPQPPTMPISGVMYGSAGNGSRSGGVSMLLPRQLLEGASIPTGLATLNSTVIESSITDVCPHFCMVDGGFGTSAAQSTATSYFGSVDDNSPYFGGFGFMQTCYTDETDSITYQNSLTVATQWDTCPTSAVLWRGFSFGAQLTSQNYEFAYSGMQQGDNLGDPTVNGTFFVAWCHRRFYAYIANQLSAWPTIPASTSDLSAFLLALFHGYDTNGTISPGAMIYGVGSNNTPSTQPPGWDATDLMSAPSSSADPYEDNENESWGCDKY
jgi:hypothetical protein